MEENQNVIDASKWPNMSYVELDAQRTILLNRIDALSSMRKDTSFMCEGLARLNAIMNTKQ